MGSKSYRPLGPELLPGKDFALRLILAREASALRNEVHSQRDLAEKTGINQSKISRWERFRGEASYNDGALVAIILRVDPGWLLCGELTTAMPSDDPIVLRSLQTALDTLYMKATSRARDGSDQALAASLMEAFTETVKEMIQSVFSGGTKRPTSEGLAIRVMSAAKAAAEVRERAGRRLAEPEYEPESWRD